MVGVGERVHWDQLPADKVGTCLPHLDRGGKARLSKYMGQHRGLRSGEGGDIKTPDNFLACAAPGSTR